MHGWLNLARHFLSGSCVSRVTFLIVKESLLIGFTALYSGASRGWGLANFPSYKYDVLGFFLVKLTSVTTLPTISNTPYGTLKNISAPPFFPVLTVKLG